jgi:hypothetical protein
MFCSIYLWLFGPLLILIPSSILAQANPFQGVYSGRFEVKMPSRNFRPDFVPSRMTVLPDGQSILITAQLPGDVVSSWALKGSFNGNLFEGVTRGRLNVNVYNWAMHYKIRFLRNEARIEEYHPLNPPLGYVQDHNVQIFYRVRS